MAAGEFWSLSESNACAHKAALQLLQMRHILFLLLLTHTITDEWMLGEESQSCDQACEALEKTCSPPSPSDTYQTAAGVATLLWKLGQPECTIFSPIVAPGIAPAIDSTGKMCLFSTAALECAASEPGLRRLW